MKLIPPTTFAESMRMLFALAALVGGIAFGLGLVALVAVLVWGGWPASLYEKIIGILGIVAIGGLVLVGITQVGILLGGPVGRFKGGVGNISFEAEDRDEPVVEAAAKGAAAGAVSAATEPKP